MKKVMNISGVECTFKSSAALPIIYRNVTDREFFSDLGKMETDISGVGFDMAYAMYRHAGGELEETDWLEQFEVMDLLNAIMELVPSLLTEVNGKSSVKKKSAK